MQNTLNNSTFALQHFHFYTSFEDDELLDWSNSEYQDLQLQLPNQIHFATIDANGELTFLLENIPPKTPREEVAKKLFDCIMQIAKNYTTQQAYTTNGLIGVTPGYDADIKLNIGDKIVLHMEMGKAILYTEPTKPYDYWTFIAFQRYYERWYRNEQKLRNP